MSKAAFIVVLLFTLMPPGAAGLVDVIQILPDVDAGSGWRIVLERVTDVHASRQALANFALELNNSAADDLSLREMRFSYRNSSGAEILAQVVSPDQMAGLLIHDTSKDNWSMSSGKAALVGKPWGEFLKAWQDLEKQGFRISDIEIHGSGNQVVYTGLFEPASYGPAALVDRPWSEFLKSWQDLEKQGYRLFDIEIRPSGGSELFTGIFKPGTYQPAALVERPWNAFLQGWQNFEKQGYRIIDLETSRPQNQTLFTGIFAPGTYTPAAVVGKAWPEFHKDWTNLDEKGFRQFDIEMYVEGGNTLYAGIFKPASYPRHALVNSAWDPFLKNWQDIEDAGMRAIDIEISPSGLHTALFGPGPPVVWQKATKLLFMSPQASFSGQLPSAVKVTLTFDGTTAPWSIDIPIATYINKNPAGSYRFPARQADLQADQFWYMGAGGGHEGPKPELDVSNTNRNANLHRPALWGSRGNYAFGQQYAYDMAVLGWNGSAWVPCKNNNDCSVNSNHYVWELPVYSAENGKVLYCWRDTPDHLSPQNPVPLPPGAPGGGNILWIQHTGGEVALYAHLRVNTIPTSICPANGLQATPAMVTSGQFLGNAGFSGSTSSPHLHFHVQASWTDNPLDWGQSLPLLFNNIDVAKAGPQQSPTWMSIKASAFVGDNAGTTTLNTLIRIRP
jgi:hypothetical protein